MRDLKNNIDAALSLSPAARTATANGAGVDLQGYEAAAALVQFGTWTDGTHTPSLQESDDNSSFTTVAAADLTGAFTAVSSGGGSNTVQRVGYIGAKRYVRGVLTVSGATTGAVSAIAIVRGVSARRPL
jgi:hypothetical protein